MCRIISNHQLFIEHKMIVKATLGFLIEENTPLKSLFLIIKNVSWFSLKEYVDITSFLFDMIVIILYQIILEI